MSSNVLGAANGKSHSFKGFCRGMFEKTTRSTNAFHNYSSQKAIQPARRTTTNSLELSESEIINVIEKMGAKQQ